MPKIRARFHIAGAKLKITSAVSHNCSILFGKTGILRIAKMYNISTISVRNGMKWGFPSTKPGILTPIRDVVKSAIPAKPSSKYGPKLFVNGVCCIVFTAIARLLLFLQSNLRVSVY